MILQIIFLSNSISSDLVELYYLFSEQFLDWSVQSQVTDGKLKFSKFTNSNLIFLSLKVQ
ncbi:hypothetical protein BpHYR1_042667 [Brachionus plicatilis]|uniref:Uncharacterized protein n=1 Tax=Brachionus plicatilis TaxID=10195 RepID=A0A3M7PC96_BRAPC|nr:hypothetical protein BpHYR1_042667 [Brachionus plicatilis]